MISLAFVLFFLLHKGRKPAKKPRFPYCNPVDFQYNKTYRYADEGCAILRTLIYQFSKIQRKEKRTMKAKKKILSIFLAACMLLTLSTTAFSSSASMEYEVYFYDGDTHTLTGTYTYDMTVSNCRTAERTAGGLKPIW